MAFVCPPASTIAASVAVALAEELKVPIMENVEPHTVLEQYEEPKIKKPKTEEPKIKKPKVTNPLDTPLMFMPPTVEAETIGDVTIDSVANEDATPTPEDSTPQVEGISDEISPSPDQTEKIQDTPPAEPAE